MRIGKKNIRHICITLTLLMLFTSFFSMSYANEENPIDVSKENNIQVTDIGDHWGSEVISEWLNNHLIIGYPDGTFRPDGKITKAEFITLINRIYGFYETTSDTYDDVYQSDWFYNAICIAKKNQYMNWYKENTLSPNSNITRQEVCAIISSIYHLKESDSLGHLDDYRDANNIPEWSKAYMSAVVKEGYLKGYEDKTLRPRGEITRAEAVIILDRVLGQLINEVGTFGIFYFYSNTD